MEKLKDRKTQILLHKAKNQSDGEDDSSTPW